MFLKDIPAVIDPVVGVLEVQLSPDPGPVAGRAVPAWTQLYRLPADPAAFPPLGGDAVHFFGPNRADPARNPFVLVYDATGAWRYTLVKESPEHPWAVEPVPADPDAPPGVRVVFTDPAHAARASALLRRLASPEGLSEPEVWNLVRSLRQASGVFAAGGA